MAETQSRVEDEEATLAQQIRRALRGIKYGSLEIVVHDSRVVQIERKEKIRFGQGLDLDRGGNSNGV